MTAVNCVRAFAAISEDDPTIQRVRDNPRECMCLTRLITQTFRQSSKSSHEKTTFARARQMPGLRQLFTFGTLALARASLANSRMLSRHVSSRSTSMMNSACAPPRPTSRARGEAKNGERAAFAHPRARAQRLLTRTRPSRARASSQLRLHRQGPRLEQGRRALRVQGQGLAHRERGVQMRFDRLELQGTLGDVHSPCAQGVRDPGVPVQPVWRARARLPCRDPPSACAAARARDTAGGHARVPPVPHCASALPCPLLCARGGGSSLLTGTASSFRSLPRSTSTGPTRTRCTSSSRAARRCSPTSSGSERDARARARSARPPASHAHAEPRACPRPRAPHAALASSSWTSRAT